MPSKKLKPDVDETMQAQPEPQAPAQQAQQAAPDRTEFKALLVQAQSELTELGRKREVYRTETDALQKQLAQTREQRTNCLIFQRDTTALDGEIGTLEKRHADLQAMSAALPAMITKTEAQIIALKSKIPADYSRLQGVYVPLGMIGCNTAIPGAVFY